MSHDTRECMKLNKKGSNPSFAKEKPHLNVIKGKIENNSLLILNGEINMKMVEILIDTGSEANYLSTEFFQTLKTTSDSTAPMKIISADGTEKMANQTKELHVVLQKIPNTTFKVKFILLEGLSFDAILGLDFLRSCQALINLKENTVALDNQEIELSCRRNREANKKATSSPDESLLR